MEYLRTQLLFTQQELAAFLGISQSLLSLYEKDLRRLPAEASLKLTELELELQQFQQKKRAPDPKDALRRRKNMIQQQKELDWNIRKAEEDLAQTRSILDQMKERQKRLNLKQAFIKKRIKAGDTQSNNMDLLHNMELAVGAALEGCDIIQQQKLTYRLLLLEAHIAAARKMQGIVKKQLPKRPKEEDL